MAMFLIAFLRDAKMVQLIVARISPLNTHFYVGHGLIIHCIGMKITSIFSTELQSIVEESFSTFNVS